MIKQIKTFLQKKKKKKQQLSVPLPFFANKCLNLKFNQTLEYKN